MSDRKQNARYYVVRGHLALWKGDPAVSGSKFRQILVTSNEWNSTEGVFQVYGIEGTGKGISGGKLAILDTEPICLFDGDFQGLETAGKKFDELVNLSIAEGFKPVTLIDVMEFQEKLRDK
jgi:hypothetical protein